MAGRALHFVFKVADRTKTIKFYRELLGMKVNTVLVQIYSVILPVRGHLSPGGVSTYDFYFFQILRHEEFTQGCEAACNGCVNINVGFNVQSRIDIPMVTGRTTIAGAKRWSATARRTLILLSNSLTITALTITNWATISWASR